MEDLWPPSFEQESVGFWKLSRPAQPFNVVAVAVAPAEVDAKRLQRAAVQLSERQPMLRCRLVRSGDNFLQANDGPPPSVEVLDTPDQGATVREALELLRARPFDESGPLARVGILPTSFGRTFLLASLDHWIADARSVELFLEQLVEIYDGRGPDVGRIGYREYAEWQRLTASSESWSDYELAYWGQVMSGARPLKLPRQSGQPTGRTAVELRLGGAHVAAAVWQVAAHHRVTPHALLTAATAQVLGRLANTDDVPLVTVVAARARPHTRDVIGCFATLRPIRCQLHLRSLAELCVEVTRSTRQALRYARISDVSLAMGVPEMIDCYLDEQNERVVVQVHVERDGIAGHDLEPGRLSHTSRAGDEHGIELEYRLSPDQLVLQAEYGTSRYDDPFWQLGSDVVSSILELKDHHPQLNDAITTS